jgi:hypothetical protein
MKDLKSGYIFLSVLLMIALSGTFAVAKHHHVEDCSVCHYSGGQESSYCKDCPNDTFVRCVIDTPNSGLRAVIFLGSTGANSYADGDSVYDGVCEVCHTQTLVHTNTDDGVNHFDGSNCIDCHPHTTQPDLFSPLPVVGVESHDTHIGENKGPRSGDCTDCHLNHSDYTLFADGEPLASTTACDDCHSPGGAFDGSQMAKTNWVDGIYAEDGTALQSGNEDWCAACHDLDPANSKKNGSGVDAPNVIGDNSTYGFYVNGHKINCLSCHDTGKSHIDHEYRTYELDEGSGNAVVNP